MTEILYVFIKHPFLKGHILFHIILHFGVSGIEFIFFYVAKKIFNIQNQTWQGKEINRDTLMRTSGALEETLKGIDKFFNKKLRVRGNYNISYGINFFGLIIGVPK